ncbi:MAG: tRNA uridine-5-carboxymethylaminomethyl(34) synthesis GTPase MnmE [Spirochaetes bacterium]|nr:tRNA uridine-5-carboxymethylaminomethyl(34) synthesis GTPase MnmE [Spirochaetota bacterium]
MQKFEDTIAAIATPAGVGAISIIRISGEASISIADKIFKGRTALNKAEGYTVHYGNIVDKDNIIDDVLITVFREPHSYTGENSVEISAHGNPFITEQIIKLLFLNSVRQADPGEFTKRAFLNGKLDLSEAEAVIDVINARTEASLRGARNQLDGYLSSRVGGVRDILIKISSMLELELDFVEEGMEFIETGEVRESLNKAVTEITELVDSFSFGRVLRDGVNVALVGKPNVGKSSLMNYLLKESRAIVSHIPGTTRDVIREELNIGGYLFKLFDTAGIRESEDHVEREGVNRSRESVENADVVLFLSEAAMGVDDEMYRMLSGLTEEKKILKVLNKSDLIEPDNLNKVKDNEVLLISSLTGAGVSDLLEELKKRAIGSKSFSEKTAVVSNVRHNICLKDALNSVNNAHDSLENGLSGEFIALDMRNAISSLGEIIGLITSDDVLDNIFGNFCIGK